jgi:uncharacterized protein (TIGR03083 family)
MPMQRASILATMVVVPPPSEPPADVALLFSLERTALLELLADVADGGWQKPTPCPDWSVLGLCAHLVGDDLGLLSRHRDQYHGTPAPDGVTEAEFVVWLDDLQAEWVRAARRLSPRLVVELLSWTGPQIVDVFSRQDPRQRTARVSWAGPDLLPVWLDQVRELSEYWIHRQQLLEALGRPSDLEPTLARPILDGLRWAYPYRLGHVRAERGDTVTISTAGEVTVTWHLVSTVAGWDFRPAPGLRRLAMLSMTTDQAWRLLSNNLSADHQARLELTGDAAVVDALRRTRAIIGAAK